MESKANRHYWVTRGGITIDGAKVVKTDIAGSNGVIHVIDTVLMPKKS